MDVLSDAVTAVRTGRPHSARVRRPAPFGERFPAVDGAGFHVVVQGSCWLRPPNGEPLRLGVGDVVFLPRGAAHALADSPSTPLADSPSTPLADRPSTPLAATFASSAETSPDGNGDTLGQAGGRGPERLGRQLTGATGAETVLLCGAYLLDRSRTHPLLHDLPEVVHLPARIERHPGLAATVELLGAELLQPRPGGDAMLPALLDVLLLQILRAWFAERADDDTATGWAAVLRDPAVAAALRAVHGDPGRQWTVGELAGRVALSRAAFARRFSRLVGRPPLAYLTWWRMTLAARLLRDGDAPLATVARQVGYASEFAFAHAFKREYGSAPGRFRRAARTEDAATVPRADRAEPT
ncbi:AraC family transcriptional regulator [Plantactinospora sp. BC1]|uniref:AraC family transcriptional regulator n=1 Tax=Plantactinospora sp. BC1 TaxID=2108470 RepID=UPI000D1530DB|nr:AraC family transcriptional regulator [Plantactinospora sp. BC1]AVT29454.1 AraC family transcriptional regulator [Plantactinospora sp. BC1]